MYVKQNLFYFIDKYSSGPICRHPLKPRDEHHISYNLEEAARLFQLIKHSIDWSTIKLSSALTANHDQNGASEMIHRDEIYARRLQAELNNNTINEPPRTTQAPTENQALPISDTTARLAASLMNLPNGLVKGCNHRCDLVSTRLCCTCSGKVMTMKDYSIVCSFASI